MREAQSNLSAEEKNNPPIHNNINNIENENNIEQQANARDSVDILDQGIDQQHDQILPREQSQQPPTYDAKQQDGEEK